MQEEAQNGGGSEKRRLWGWQETEGPGDLVKTGGCQSGMGNRGMQIKAAPAGSRN